MPLVRIEVCDFKSYRGHQTIGPFRNFTSVIGPNGAGKSNLMDAISFVLGVKSAQLRSSQLKDLVYRGGKLAAPPEEPSEQIDEEEEQGPSAKRAWVLAVFHDGEKEWLFQRIISTTGTSEYKLNGRTVTYSAYNAALISHNILVKAKNFLVFQGDVEAVASQSPKELTRLIEQISGSLELAPEYEKAKEAQERATENATFNFTKRRGITGEIRQYKEQKNEVDRYEKLYRRKDELILRRTLYKLYHIEESLKVNASEIQRQNRALVGLREDQHQQQQALDRARAEQAKAKTEVSREERRLKRAEKALEAERPELVTAEAQISHATRKKANSAKLKEQVAKDVEKKQEKISSYHRDLEIVRQEADRVQEEQRRAAEGSASLSEENLEEYRRLKANANVLVVDERQSLKTLDRDFKTATRSLDQLRERVNTFEEQRNKLERDADDVQQKSGNLEGKVSDLDAELRNAKKELEKQHSERLRISQLEREINEKLGEIYQQLLQASVDRQESEKEARLKENLTNLSRIFPGVRGRVVDLCKPTQRKYELAVAVILGRNMDAVVVDEEKTAIDCIEYMRNHRAGHATFIPLDSIQVKPINDKYRSFAKGSRLAIDVIQYEPAVERAIQHACGNALVCDSMDVARYVVFDKGQEVKAVTLDGTVIHKSGLITGGRSTRDSTKKWDETDVNGLNRVKGNLHNQLSELQSKKPRGKADETLLLEMERLESSLTFARDDLNATQLRRTGILQELEHVRGQLDALAPQLNAAAAVHEQLRDQVETLQAVISEADDSVFGDFCGKIGVGNIRDYEERQLKVAQAVSEARHRFDTQIARLTTQVKFEEEQLRATQARLDDLDNVIRTEDEALVRHEQTKQRIEAEIQEAETNIEELKEDLAKANEDLENRTTEVEQAKKTFNKATKGVDQVLKDIVTKNGEIEKLGLERSTIYRRCRVDEIKIPLLKGNLKNVPMEESLREEVAMEVDGDEDEGERPKKVQTYGIEVDYSELEDEEMEDSSPEAADRFDEEIVKVTAEIERMAPNLKAVERLDDVEAKLVETEKEAEKARKDSKNARDQFNDVKQRRFELFMKAYSHVSDRIDGVYKDLTRGKASPMGGVAYLSLEDSEEPYVAGIKYHAMPPMKRFRDMEQLSGGEKTIAALALLFAIHSFHPSPFFVLDEVDAALDNTNVAKIANYIRTQASDTFQFIVISLKGSLYERSNSLVGIYRDQDVNSSKTLTLDLTQYGE